MNKYHNRPTIVDGVTWDSVREARRYQELKLLWAAGEIVNLHWHTPFALVVKRVKICDYIADFVYEEKTSRGNYVKVVEDVKSPATRTPVYRLKKKLMLAIWGIEIRET